MSTTVEREHPAWCDRSSCIPGATDAVHLAEPVTRQAENGQARFSAVMIRNDEYAADGRVTYTVADNGRGIAPADCERVFELFRRSAHSLKSNSNTFGATDLGLLARDLETQGLDATPAPALDALDAEYARAAAALRALCDG